MKKRLLVTLTIVCALFVLTGCAQDSSQISLDTKFSDISGQGVFTALLTYPLAQGINWLTPKVGLAAAMAIITLALNIIILAFTFKSNVGMQKMQDIQPEIAKIQKKYEGREDESSQMRMNQEMQQLYEKNHLNPIGILIATFIQLPVLVCMYSAVRRAEAVSTGTFMGVSLSITPLEAFTAGIIIPLVIYVLMIVTQFLSMKLPQWLAAIKGKKNKHYEKPKEQNPLLTYGMLIMISFAMLNWPTVLSLYYCIYSIINVVKTLVIDLIIKKGK